MSAASGLGGWTPRGTRRLGSGHGRPTLATDHTTEAKLQSLLDLPSCSPAQGPESWGSSCPLLQPPQLHWTSLLALPLQGWCPLSAIPAQPPASVTWGSTICLSNQERTPPPTFQSQPHKMPPGLLPPHWAHPVVRLVSTGSNPHPTHQHFPTFTPIDSGTSPSSLPAPVQPGQ